MNNDVLLLKEKIIKYAKEIGIAKIGVAEATPLEESLEAIATRARAGYTFNTNSGYQEKKVNPFLHLPDTKSVIVIAIPYGRSIESKAASVLEGVRGTFSKVSWGQDYHRVVMDLLNNLAQYIKEQEPSAETLPLVDSGHLLEKPFAVRAGLGWIGKNSLLITPEYGSFVFLGLLLTNLPLPTDISLTNKCGPCTRCIKNCPTEALAREGNLNLDKCIANLCLYGDVIEDDLREKFSNRLYGCDICQEACPYNERVEIKIPAPFEPKEQDIRPRLEEILLMSNKEFKARFGYMAGSWRGKKPILRNAILAAGNSKDPSLVPILKTLVEKNLNPSIRALSAWALGKIGTLESKKILEEILDSNKEEAQEVLEEIEKALKK